MSVNASAFWSTLLLAISTVISFAVAFYAWTRRGVPGGRQLAILMAMVAWWSLTLAPLRLVTSAEILLLIFKLQYFSVVTIPVLWLIFVLHYTRRHHWLTTGRMLMLLIVPAVTLILVLTSDRHNLILNTAEFRARTSFAEIQYVELGPWAWFDTFYDYALLVIGSLILLRNLLSLPRPYTFQVRVLLISMFIMWFFNVLYILRIVPAMELAALGFVLSGLGMAWGVLRYQLLDLIPVACEVLSQGMPDPMIVLNVKGRIAHTNPAAQRLIGASYSELVGRSLDETLPELSPAVAALQKDTVRTEWEYTTSDGHVYSYDVVVSSLYDRLKQREGTLLVLRDVTELQAAKLYAQSVERMKSEFVKNVSHELRTPLTNIKLYLNLLKRGDERKHPGYLATLFSEVEYLQGLVEELLSISRLDMSQVTPHFQWVALDRFLQSLYTDHLPLFEDRGLAFHLNVPPDLPPVCFDAKLMRQVFNYLLVNALNYTAKGEARLSVSVLERDGSCWIAMQVSDTGLGMAEQELNGLFERFQRGAASREMKTPGVGLGLATSKEIVELHGGEIRVESELGQGSTFTVLLPLEEAGPGG